MRARIRMAALAAVFIVANATPAAASPLVMPIRGEDGFPIKEDPPPVTAASWILYDESSDSVLAEWDADTERPMASITKIMTVLLAIENGHPEDDVLVSEEAAGTGGQEIGLVAGETVKLKALVKAALIRSGNDAAAAIAEHIGGSVDGFVGLMNDRAIELGMTHTRFANPHGLDEPGHYSTPRDMLTLARTAMSIQEFEEIARARAMVFPDSPGGEQRSASNTNRIINSYDGVIGVKTGETPNAGLTYVGAVERDGRRVFAVVFHSVGRRAHFADAITLFEWAFDDLRINGTLAAGVPYRSVAAMATETTLDAEATIDSYLRVAAQNGVDDPYGGSKSTKVVDLVRAPDPAPTSLFTTLTYWLGLFTGTFDG